MAEREDIDEDELAHEKKKGDSALDRLADTSEDQPCYKTAFQWVCGVENVQEKEISEEEKKAFEKKQQSIHETGKAKMALNINALLLMTLAVFMWGFYA